MRSKRREGGGQVADGDEKVSAKVCEVVHENLNEQAGTTLKRLDAHSQEIKELTRIGDRLTQLIELQTKHLENQTKQLEDYGRRLDGVEKEVSQVHLPPPTQTQTTTTTTHEAAWYESSTGSLVVKTGMVILVMLVAAAIGMNYKDAVSAVVQ